MPSTDGEKFKETSMTIATNTEAFGAVDMRLTKLGSAAATPNYPRELFCVKFTVYVKAAMAT